MNMNWYGFSLVVLITALGVGCSSDDSSDASGTGGKKSTSHKGGAAGKSGVGGASGIAGGTVVGSGGIAGDSAEGGGAGVAGLDSGLGGGGVTDSAGAAGTSDSGIAGSPIEGGGQAGMSAGGTTESGGLAGMNAGGAAGASSTCTNGCLIADTCYPQGVNQPGNLCSICDTARSTVAWSGNDGAACDDGAFCTVGDRCAAGTCAGTARNCSDGVACNGVETCNEATDACVAGTTTCTTGTICDRTSGQCVATCSGCVISGTCYGEGQSNPSNGCQKCVKAASASGWTNDDGAACDDGAFCTVGDSCTSGACTGTARSCSDGVACNGTETCAEAADLCAAGTTTCTSGNVCNPATDQCIAMCSGCVIASVCYSEGQTNPVNRCQKCVTLTSASAWSNDDGAACDDGAYCTGADTCSGGTCSVHAGNPCTASGIPCDEAKNRCYDPTRAVDAPSCNAAGDVVQHDAIGTEILVQDCAPAASHGTCTGGVCGCTDGLTGESCEKCLIHVDGAKGKDDNDGSTWTQALGSVQTGLDTAADKVNAGATACEVWVAAGKYLPTGADRTSTILLKDKVGLYGGFAGSETLRGARDVKKNVTILSGDIGTVGSAADNSYHVVTGVTGATIDGFTITGGNADGSDQSANGGGMFNDETATPTVANCTFRANGATLGGGMFNNNASPTVTSCTFTDNTATGDGGGMYNVGGTPTVANSSFTGNRASQNGGGMYNYASSLASVTSSSFIGNVTTGSGGGMYNRYSSPTITSCTFSGNGAMLGAGMYNSTKSSGTPTFPASSPTVTSSSFIGNVATANGGGMYNGADSKPTLTTCSFSSSNATSGGGMYNDAASPTLSSCSFKENGALYGGGMFNGSASSPVIDNSSFSSNSAVGYAGGGIVNADGSSPTVTNCTFAGNTAAQGGGMVSVGVASLTVVNSTFIGNSGTDYGGGMVNFDANSVAVTNCTFFGNLAAQGGGMVNGTATVAVTNSIFWGNVASSKDNDFWNISSTAVTYSIVAGGCTVAAGCTSSDTGNLDGDPLFVDAAGGDLHLKSGSPAIDAGTGCPSTSIPATDKDGKGRWDITSVTNASGTLGVDIGAYEFQGAAGDTALTAICP
jgi:hypothetical protein